MSGNEERPARGSTAGVDVGRVRLPFDRYGARQLRVLGAVLALCWLAATIVLFATWDGGGRTAFGVPLGGDFPSFYSVGAMLDRGRAAQLYQPPYLELERELFPTLPDDRIMWFAHAPYSALVYAPLARLPYPLAFAAWLLVSALLVLAGLFLAWRVAGGIPDRHFGAVIALTFLFEPILMETFLGGQITPIPFFFFSLALFLDHRSRPLAAGLALAFCSYKPTWLVLFLPALVFGRRGRVLAGLAIGCVPLALVSWATVGSEGMLDYGRMLLRFSADASRPVAAFDPHKYVDLNSFLDLLLPDGWVWPAFVAIASPLAAVLWLAWFRGAERSLLWAATLAWTLALNLYAPVYDSSVVALGVMLVAGQVFSRFGALTPGFRWLLALMVIVPWISQPLSRMLAFRPYTPLLVAVGLYALYLARGGRGDDADRTGR